MKLNGIDSSKQKPAIQNLEENTASLMINSSSNSDIADDTEVKKSEWSSIRRKEEYNPGENIYGLRFSELNKFRKKNLTHMIVNNISSIKNFRSSSFNQFYILSASPKDVDPLSRDSLSRKYLDPFSCQSIHVVDRYPQVSSTIDNVLTPEEVASFCFPSGVKLKLIPGCTLEKGAEEIGLVGEKGDRYQLHTVRKKSVTIKYESGFTNVRNSIENKWFAKVH